MQRRSRCSSSAATGVAYDPSRRSCQRVVVQGLRARARARAQVLLLFLHLTRFPQSSQGWRTTLQKPKWHKQQRKRRSPPSSLQRIREGLPAQFLSQFPSQFPSQFRVSSHHQSHVDDNEHQETASPLLGHQNHHHNMTDKRRRRITSFLSKLRIGRSSSGTESPSPSTTATPPGVVSVAGGAGSVECELHSSSNSHAVAVADRAIVQQQPAHHHHHQHHPMPFDDNDNPNDSAEELMLLYERIEELEEENQRLRSESRIVLLETFEGEGLMDECDVANDETECPIEPNVSFGQALRDRAYWLVGLLVLQSFSGIILAHNEALLVNHPVIVYFLTMLVGAGGNAGNQASVRVIRGLALGTLNADTQVQFLVREVKMAVALSGILSMAGFVRAAVFATPWPETVAITVALAMIVLSSVCLGAVLPLVLQKLRIDPAHSSTTIQVVMDILGVLLAVCVSSALLDSPLGVMFIEKLGVSGVVS